MPLRSGPRAASCSKAKYACKSLGNPLRAGTRLHHQPQRRTAGAQVFNTRLNHRRPSAPPRIPRMTERIRQAIELCVVKGMPAHLPPTKWASACTRFARTSKWLPHPRATTRRVPVVCRRRRRLHAPDAVYRRGSREVNPPDAGKDKRSMLFSAFRLILSQGEMTIRRQSGKIMLMRYFTDTTWVVSELRENISCSRNILALWMTCHLLTAIVLPVSAQGEHCNPAIWRTHGCWHKPKQRSTNGMSQQQT